MMFFITAFKRQWVNGSLLQDIWMLLTWIRVKYCPALWRDLAWDKCYSEAALAQSWGQCVLCSEGHWRRKIDHISFLLPPSISSSLLFLWHNPSFIVSLLHSPTICFTTPPTKRVSPWLGLCISCSTSPSIHPPINSVYMLDEVHASIRSFLTFPPQRVRPGHRSECICRFALLCFMEAARMLWSVQKKR